MVFNNDLIKLNFNNSMFEYNKVPISANMPIYHFHDFYEIYYLISGKRNYFIKNRMYSMESGDIAFINSNTIHRTTSQNDAGYERILIYIDKAFLNSLSSEIREYKPFSIFTKPSSVVRLDAKQKDFIEVLFQNIVDNYNRESEINKTFAEMLITDLLVYMNMCTEKSASFVGSYIHSKCDKISEIIPFINENYMYDISLSDIKSKFFVSISYLTKTFKLATGFTFLEYLNCVRIKEAQYMIDLTDLPISQVAERVGFNSVNHFCRVFREVSGTSPSAYKKNNRIVNVGRAKSFDVFRKANNRNNI